MNIDRSKLSKIEADIVAALSQVAANHGLISPVIDLRRANTGTFCRLMRLDFVVANPATTEPAPFIKSSTGVVSTQLAAAMKRLGITKTTNSKGETLVDFKSSRPKYPFTFTGPRGGRWKDSEARIAARFR